MNKWLKGLVFVCVVGLFIAGTACGRKIGNESITTGETVSETGASSEPSAGEIQNPANDAGTQTEKPQKTEEPLAADEEKFAEMDQVTLVKTIDHSLVAVFTQTQLFIDMFDEFPEGYIFTADELDRIATKVELVKDLIYQAEEQIEVYYYLYGEHQTDFIAFLITVEEDLDAELFKVVAIFELIRNSETPTEENSERIINSVMEMNNLVENLKLKQEKFVATFEKDINQK